MQVTLNVPESYLLDHTPEEWGRRIRLYAALRMFQSGEISAGAAAELAEIDRYTFAEECRRHGVPLIDYPPQDLQTELDSLLRSS